jgi:CheY-like chemotaxis protein
MSLSLNSSAAPARLLIVEDNFDSAEVLSLLLQREGFDVRIALDAQEALDVIVEFYPDVAILDIGLPGITGYELVAKLRSKPELTACRFVALTGYTGSEIAKRTASAGFDAHLTKPFDLPSLRRVMSGFRPATPVA